MKLKFIFFLVSLTFLLLATRAEASCDGYSPFISMTSSHEIKGIDTIIVSVSYPGGYFKPVLNPVPDPNSVLFEEASTIFANEKWLKVYPHIKDHQIVNLERVYDSNVAIINFKLSGHKETYEGKPFSIISMTFNLVQEQKTSNSSVEKEIAIQPSSYAFIWTDNEDDIKEHLVEGARYLMGWLPNRFAQENGHPFQPEGCDDFYVFKD